jgi:hypothetical protein
VIQSVAGRGAGEYAEAVRVLAFRRPVAEVKFGGAVQGVCFLPLSVTRRYPGPEIADRRVDDVPPAAFSIAWPQQTRSRAIAAFVRAAEKAAASRAAAVSFPAR